MRVLFAVLSLTAVAVFALRGDERRGVEPRDVQKFRSAQEYRFQLDTQISSGFADVSQQNAITRLQAQVYLAFQSDRSVVMRMDNILMGSLNRDVQEPEKVYPMQMFKKSQVEGKELEQLTMPCQFDYVDGIIENIRFHQDDKSWAKNIKRSVLNMLQSNLKQRTGLVELKPLEGETKEQDNMPVSDIKMFTLPEMTLEGECQTTYTINKVQPLNKYNRYSESSDEDSIRMFNVTKSVDFKQCKKIADIRFGPKTEKTCEKCNVEKIEERKLDRTTVIRQSFVGTPQEFGLQKVELVSHYVFKAINAEEQRPMHTIVAGELTYVEAQEQRQSRQSELRNMGQSEPLIYSIEWDEQEKRFYMYGDEEFPNFSPFKSVSNKVNNIEKHITRLVNLWSDKVQGIESEATGIFTKIIDLVRMCTIEELKQIHSKIGRESDRLTETEQLKAEEIFVDALANAGTRNTIEFLVEKILKKDIEGTRAVRAITHLKGLPAPSEKQVEILLRLCQSEVAARSEPLRQTCWLTTGAIIGQLCNNEIVREDGYERNLPKPICHREQKQKFVKAILDLYKKAETRYEKVLALKTLGNAGLDESVQELEKIVRNIQEDPIVRMQAVDSFRRLRALMPKKIQRVLLPIFQDVRERPEIRMAAISMILPTIPEKQMLDQIGFTLLKEPSRQVKSYVYTAMKYLSESPIEAEKQLSQRLNSLLKLAGITEEDEQELLRGSRFFRVPIYSEQQREGFLTELESMVGPDNYLPKQLKANIDAVFSGILEKNGVEFRLNQENLENWYHKIYETMIDQFTYGSRKQSQLRANRRSDRDSSSQSSEENEDTMRSMYKSLNIKKRTRNSFWRIDSDENTEIEPFGMFCFRYADVDYAIVPLEEELLPESIKNYIVKGEKPSMRDFEDLVKFFQGRHFRAQAAFNLLEKSVKIPTSMGLPLRMLHVVPVLASVDGQIKAKLSGSELVIDSKVHPVLTATHLKRVEVWSPIVMSGAESSQTIELNIPVDSQLKIENGSPKNAKLAIKVPTTKIQIFGLHTLPHTFVADVDRQSQLPKMPVIKRIDNMRLQHQLRSVETVYGQESVDLPIKVTGDIHLPRELTSYQRIINALLTSENHLHITFEPNHNSPQEIVMLVDGQAFLPQSERSEHRQLKGFYNKAKFDDEYERYYESDEEQDDDERRLNTFLDNYEPRKMYKHQSRIQIKTVGGRQDKYGKLELEAACDERVKYCTGKAIIRRSPIYEGEREWEMTVSAQTLYPEYVRDVEELEQQDKKHQKFVAQMEAEWGTSGRKEQIQVNINGEQFKPKNWLKKMSQVERYDEQSSLREQMLLKIAFLNKYDISATYNTQPWTKNMLSQWFTGLKAINWWNTQVQQHQGRDGYVFATVVIDPITHEHVNMTIKTPNEKVQIDSISLPIKAKLFQLVRKTQTTSRSDSFMDVVRSYTTQTRPECQVDGRRIQTFDEVTYKAPLTKCYAVLAKDCSSETPRFAVLMKKLDGDNKKIKMISGKQIFEVEPRNGKLVVKINGDRVDDVQELLEYGIDLSENMIHIDSRDVSVRFNGEKIWVKLAQTHKNTQCGLCGHYNDNAEDVFRMANNDIAQDLKEFHRSYSLMDDECKADLEETHRQQRYERMDSDELDWEVPNHEEKKKPFEKTHVMEYGHKVCFSEKPIKECPRGTEPTEEKEHKIKYICLQRTSSEGRRLLNEARRNPKTILELPQQNPSFTETMKIPAKCEVY